MKTKPSVLALVLVNLFPIFGVLFLGWNLSGLLFLYWFENIAVGFYNILKMIKAQKPNKKGINMTFFGKKSVHKSKLSVVLFFIFHYGFFTYLHGLFLFRLLKGDLNINLTLLPSMGLLFISHGVSYFANYIGKREYELLSSEDLMFAPYKRMIIMHMAIIFGGSLILSALRPLGFLVVLTIIKIVTDFFSHTFEHNKLIPIGDKKLGGNIPYIEPKALSKIFPNYEKTVADTYRKSVATGKWDQIKKQMDPQAVNYIEDYWLRNYRISSKK